MNLQFLKITKWIIKYQNTQFQGNIVIILSNTVLESVLLCDCGKVSYLVPVLFTFMSVSQQVADSMSRDHLHNTTERHVTNPHEICVCWKCKSVSLWESDEDPGTSLYTAASRTPHLRRCPRGYTRLSAGHTGSCLASDPGTMKHTSAIVSFLFLTAQTCREARFLHRMNG